MMLRKKGGGRLYGAVQDIFDKCFHGAAEGFRPLLGAAENKDVFLSRSHHR